MKKALCVLLLAVCFITQPVIAAQKSHGRDKVIYGDDNRTEVFNTKTAMFAELANSTAAMISSSDLIATPEGYKLTSQDLRSRGMCSSERFLTQPTAAMCSGFLVAPDTLVTAGHCVRSASDCRTYKWVFDYKMSTDTTINMSMPADNVYSCKQVVATVLDSWGNKNDYAVIKLDREVTGRRPLEVRTEGAVAVGDPLVVIGHPTGLPTKIADGAHVRSINEEFYFVANLDTYGGNSGSAVFNADTGIVEGILVRGENDYVSSGNCRVSKVCTDTGCRGEDVTRITAVKEI